MTTAFTESPWSGSVGSISAGGKPSVSPGKKQFARVSVNQGVAHRPDCPGHRRHRVAAPAANPPAWTSLIFFNAVDRVFWHCARHETSTTLQLRAGKATRREPRRPAGYPGIVAGVVAAVTASPWRAAGPKAPAGRTAGPGRTTGKAAGAGQATREAAGARETTGGTAGPRRATRATAEPRQPAGDGHATALAARGSAPPTRAPDAAHDDGDQTTVSAPGSLTPAYHRGAWVGNTERARVTRKTGGRTRPATTA